MLLWVDRSLLSIARSNHLVVLVNGVIPFLHVGIGQELHILLGNNPAPFCSSRRLVRGRSQTLRPPARELSRFLPVIQR
jgi:hypothetical protein